MRPDFSITFARFPILSVSGVRGKNGSWQGGGMKTNGWMNDDDAGIKRVNAFYNTYVVQCHFRTVFYYCMHLNGRLMLRC